MFRGDPSTIRKEEAKNLPFPSNKEKHDMQLYNTVSQKFVTVGWEAFLHSAELLYIYMYILLHCENTELMFMSKGIWGDGKEGAERGPTKIHVQY